MRRTRAVATLFLALIVSGTFADVREETGRVINRDGAGQAYCRVEFRQPPAPEPLYVVTTNSEGFFFLTNPADGVYDVTVTRDDRMQRFPEVRIDGNGISPSTLVVYW